MNEFSRSFSLKIMHKITRKYHALFSIMIILTGAAVVMCACASSDFTVVRQHQTEQFLADLDNKTAVELPPSRALSLRDCIRLAEENSLALTSARIRQRVSTLERKVAFSNFLPAVNAGLTYEALQHDPMAKIGSSWARVSDRDVTQTSVALQQRLFAPYTWFLYDMFRKGEDIQKLLTLRTRQLISLQVTALYYQCRSLKATGRFLTVAEKQARELLKEINAAEQHGLAKAGDRAETEALVLTRRFQREENSRQLQQTKARLLEAMGLYPFADIELTGDSIMEAPLLSLENLIIEAMLSRPELKISDREHAIEQDKIKTAITAFLPDISAFAGFSGTTDSFVKYQSQWAGGITGIISLFNGFANINNYKAAREHARDVFVKREQTCFMVMLQVHQAFLDVASSADLVQVTEKTAAAQEEKFREENAAWDQGLVTSSRRLQSLARRDQTAVQHMIAGFNHQVAVATLYDVIGRDVR